MRTHLPDVIVPVLNTVVLPRLRTSFEILARANGTPTEELDRAWEEVQLSVAKGGSNIGGHADVADACFVAAFLAVWPSLRDRPAYHGHALLAAAYRPSCNRRCSSTSTNTTYNSIRDRCIKLWGAYRARAKHVDFGMVNNYNLGYYRPSGLPLVTRVARCRPSPTSSLSRALLQSLSRARSLTDCVARAVASLPRRLRAAGC